MTTLTPLRIHKTTMETVAPRSCTGWGCSCAAPFGFGENRNSICQVYGPGPGADPVDIASYKRRNRTVAHLRMMKETKVRETALESAVKRCVNRRIEKALAKKRETLDWHLDFEDQVRTQNFFEMRDRELRWEREDEETVNWWKKRAESAEEWDRYREAEMASSARSIRNLMSTFQMEQ